jgi:hypothetical protein
MIADFILLPNLDTMHNDQHRKLFRLSFMMLPDVVTSAPTTDTLPAMCAQMYESGSTRRIYFNFMGTLTYWGLTNA